MSFTASLRNLQAPAKLNLFLHVTGRRADGYHLLESVFMRIDWCDTLHLHRREDNTITRADLGNDSGTDLGEADLCVRAARALQTATGCTLGAHIELEKRIPAQAGMGGGSSDAATVLMGLAQLWFGDNPARLAEVTQRLPDIAVKLGADVPFFLLGQHALVWGIGEQMRPIDLPESRFVVIKPAAGVATPAIFGHPDLERNAASALCSATNMGIMEGFAAHPYGFGHNSLQPVAESLCPDISRAIAWLASKGLTGRMTGSGSAVFAPLEQGQGDPDLSGPPAGFTARICSNRA
jgi:4-diphosphocytidyl-2-C-methyl-D-erythritol kinase